MKSLSAALLLFIAALFSGCTSNIVKEDFQSDGKYFDYLNKSIEGKSVKLVTKDSTFKAEEVMVDNDSLRGQVSWSHYQYYNRIETIKKFSMPLQNIESIDVTKRTAAMFKGIGIGMITGGVWGGLFFDFGGESNSGHHTGYAAGAIFSMLPGLVLGGLIGAIVGDDYVFSFDNRLNSSELFGDNSSHRAGIKLGYHYGFAPFNMPGEGYYAGNTAINSAPVPGVCITAFYNYPLGKNFSSMNELSFISAGSDETPSVYIPTDQFSYDNYKRKTVREHLNIFELAPLIRLNLLKDSFTPYVFIGPRFDFLLPVSNSGKEQFYADVNKTYGSPDLSISGHYRNFFWGGTIGAGVSTGKMLHYELLLEIRYNMEYSSQFDVYSYSSKYEYYFYQDKYWDVRHISNELIISAGVAVF